MLEKGICLDHEPLSRDSGFVGGDSTEYWLSGSHLFASSAKVVASASESNSPMTSVFSLPASVETFKTVKGIEATLREPSGSYVWWLTMRLEPEFRLRYSNSKR